MSNTKTYSAIRLLNHLLVIAQLSSVVALLLISIASWDFFNIETHINFQGLNLFICIVTLGFINLIVPFFCACAIDSGVRLYMKLFSVYAVLNIILNLLLYLYLDKKLLSRFQETASMSLNNQQSTAQYLQKQYNCSAMTDRDCLTVFSEMLETSIRYIKFNIIAFCILNTLMAILVKVTLSVKMRKNKMVRPKIKRQAVGFSTNSLRKKKLVLETNSLLDESVLSIDRGSQGGSGSKKSESQSKEGSPHEGSGSDHKSSNNEDHN